AMVAAEPGDEAPHRGLPAVPRQNAPGMLYGTTVTKNSQRPTTSLAPSRTAAGHATPLTARAMPAMPAVNRATVHGPSHRSSSRTEPHDVWSGRRPRRHQFSAVDRSATAPPTAATSVWPVSADP